MEGIVFTPGTAGVANREAQQPPENVPDEQNTRRPVEEGGSSQGDARYQSIVPRPKGQPLPSPSSPRRASTDGHHQHSNSNSASNPTGRRRSRSSTVTSGRSNALKERHADPQLDLSLPYRTLTADANFDEFTTENPAGEIAGPAERRAPDGRPYRLVTFVPGDAENPKNWSRAYKWYATMIVAITCFVVAFASSVITADIAGVVDEFGVGQEVALVSITVFVVGFGVGPMIFAPLSEIYGRRIIYGSTLLAAVIFIIPCALATNIETLLENNKTGKQDHHHHYHVTEQDLDMRPTGERLGIFLIRPFQLLFGELIVFLISLYMSVLYGLLYMFFIAFPIIYQKGKGFTAGQTGLMFIPCAIGVLISAFCAPFVNNHYLKLVRKHNGKPPAEVRLIPMMCSCWFIPIGLFIFAWTSYPHMSWAGPAMGGFCVGFGFIFLYNSANNYLVDSYQHQAASALAAKTFIRSFWGAAVVLFTEQMYGRLGDQWASTLLAFVGVACCAIPFLFWRYGAAIRRRSRYAYGGDEDDGAGQGHSSSSDADVEKGKDSAAAQEPARDMEDLRRARSYVSNP
ncbi:hypothetical protein MAPG_01630 [Magnaporthiopsis poae ATCC 64411]|uniref:Major facilitator superfamily (MFS) profile domain-containing protein n=1 Tax=Magnaporthiopsis poae (strain ATCC 64411 / 73-15) TaxID=644358 RepID=A0A0C4DP76_MAGP6|nr:hypothetical protein MAPG_01630 [Magnaporthiopsis poae ATCC 64411]